MNKEFFENNWKQIRSQTPGWWSLMSDSDLIKVDKSAVKYDKYLNFLRVKYGYSAEQAKKEVTKRVAEHDVSLQSKVTAAE